MLTIMVQFSDEQWTLEAIHLASALARNLNGQVVLLYLSLAPNPGLLGWGIVPPTLAEERQMQNYGAVAEDYGVVFRVQPVQFIALAEALVQTSDALGASALFAHLPSSPIPVWRQLQLWNLKRRLGECQLYTLEKDRTVHIKEPVSATIKAFRTK